MKMNRNSVIAFVIGTFFAIGMTVAFWAADNSRESRMQPQPRPAAQAAVACPYQGANAVITKPAACGMADMAACEMEDNQKGGCCAK